MKYSHENEYLQMKLIGLVEENYNGYLKLRNYLYGAKCRNYEKEVVPGGIRKNKESSKTLFNQKNTLWTCELYHTLNNIYYNFCICTQYFSKLSK